MTSLQDDPVINGINEIRKSIEVVIDNECYGAAIILIFAGIDAMSHISRPDTEDYNDSKDFKNWVEKYFHIHGETHITSEEWWAARNAIVHTYGAYSKLHTKKDVRVLLWMVDGKPHIMYKPKVSEKYVSVDIPEMKRAFFKGMQNFLVEGFKDPTRKELMESRLREIIQKKATS